MTNQVQTKNISIDDLDKIKEEGYRPSVIAALVHNRKVALFKSNFYPGYEFVQGGIDFGELPGETIEREVIEELGFWFYSQCHFPPREIEYLFSDRLQTKVKETLVTSTNKRIIPVGKHYLVYLVHLNIPESVSFPMVDPSDSEFKGTTVKFHECVWADAPLAKKLVQTITSPKKREIALQAIRIMEINGTIAK